jgi:hypothetical protein
MINKSIPKIISGFIFSGLVLFSSCKKDENWKPEPSLSASLTSLTINATGQNFSGSDFSISILSSRKWSAASSESWLKLPRPNGANDGYLIFKADTNFSGERKAKITVSSEGVEPFVVDVKQTASVTVGDISSSFDLTKIPFNSEGFSLSIENDLKQNITISTSDSWIGFSFGSSGPGTSSLSSKSSNIYFYVNYDQNTGSSNRTGTFTIKNKTGEIVKTYTITQLFDTFTAFFTGVNWQLKKATEYTSPGSFTVTTIPACISDNKTKFTKSSFSSGGTYARDNGSISSSCSEFEQTSTGSYSVYSTSSGQTTLSSYFNYDFDSETDFYVEKITGDSLKLRDSNFSGSYKRYEFVKVQ